MFGHIAIILLLQEYTFDSIVTMSFIQFTIPDTHPCFNQIALFTQFFIGQLGTMSLINTLESIAINTLQGLPSSSIKPNVLSGNMKLQSTDNDGWTEITDAYRWFEYLGGLKTPRPAEISFNTNLTESASSQIHSKGFNKTSENSRFMIEQLTCQAIGTAFEVNKEHIQNKLGSNPQRWPTELQFFRHCRNACFHGNKFNISTQKPNIDTLSPPSWRTFSIPDLSLNGTRFAEGYFPYHFVLPLLAEVGMQIEQL